MMRVCSHLSAAVDPPTTLPEPSTSLSVLTTASFMQRKKNCTSSKTSTFSLRRRWVLLFQLLAFLALPTQKIFSRQVAFIPDGDGLILKMLLPGTTSFPWLVDPAVPSPPLEVSQLRLRGIDAIEELQHASGHLLGQRTLAGLVHQAATLRVVVTNQSLHRSKRLASNNQQSTLKQLTVPTVQMRMPGLRPQRGGVHQHGRRGLL